MRPTESPSITATKLTRIAWLSARDRHKRFDCLMHHFNEASLQECFDSLDGRQAVGADGVTKRDDANRLEENLEAQVARMRRMAYRPGPVRRVEIPKGGTPGTTRPLGISNLEDKLVQRMMHRVLESIYEPLFLDCSYGFRPGRGCHDAIRSLQHPLYSHEVEVVIDLDLERFFDTIDHHLLEEILREKIQDQRFMRDVARMLKAGVLTEGELSVSEEGVPQGSICSPILSNIFAHDGIDTWFEEVVKRYCKGQVELFRYADDGVICCQHAHDAQRIVTALGKRLTRFGLKLNDEKTRLVPFSKRAYRRGQKQGTFDFLGFTFYGGKSRKGAAIPKLKSSGKRLGVKRKRVNPWAGGVRNRYPLRGIWKICCAKLHGHIRYDGVSFNLAWVGKFLYEATRILFKWLNRRSQRRSFNWETLNLFLQANPLPRARIYHSLIPPAAR